MRWAILTKNFHWASNTFAHFEESFANRLSERMAQSGIHLRQEFFKVLSDAVKNFDNPRGPEEEIELMINIFETIHGESQKELFKALLQERQQEISAKINYPCRRAINI